MLLLYICFLVNCRVFVSCFFFGGDRYLWDLNFFLSFIVWLLENLICFFFFLCRGCCMKWFYKNGFGIIERNRNKY